MSLGSQDPFRAVVYPTAEEVWHPPGHKEGIIVDSVTTNIHRSTESGIKAHQADVQLRQRPEREGPHTESDAVKVTTGSSPEEVPSNYMMLISRIDNMMRRGQVDSEPVDELGSLLTLKISRMPAASRRALVALPEMQALEVENLAHLPLAIARRVFSGEDTAAVLNLLRNTTFASAIKDETRNTTYGPRGYLLAS